MAFTAYPSRGIIQKICFLLAPVVLLGLMITITVYEDVMNRRLDHPNYSVRNFLILMIVAMVPLVVVQKKLTEFPDPIATISKFTPKLFLMHMAVLVVRILTGFIYAVHTRFFLIRNIVFLIGMGLLVPTFYRGRLTRANLLGHFDVVLLLTVAVATALATEEYDVHSTLGSHHWAPRWYRNRVNVYVLSSCSDYMELLAFMPAVWMLCRDYKGASAAEPNAAEASRRARFLFLFTVSFYGFEDLHSAITLGWDLKFAAAGHLMHLLLVFNFAAYIFYHLFTPPEPVSEKPSLLKEDVEISSANENMEV